MTNQNDCLYDAPGVRASISALLAQPATDAWQTVLRQVGREYRPLTDTQAHQMCLRLHEDSCPADERTRLRETLSANCAPLALKAARDFASQFGGDWRAALAAAYEILHVQIPGVRQSVSRKGVVTLVPTGYNAKKALVNLHGWLVLSFNTDMVKKAQQNRASANTTTTQDMAFAKQAWAASLDRLGNTFRPESALDARKTCIQVPAQREFRNVEWFTPTFLIEWGKLDVPVNFALRPVRREEVSFGVAGLRAVRQAAEAEVSRLGARVRVTHAKAIQDLITKKGFTEDAAVKSVLNKVTEQPRRLLRTLAESPDILTVWLSGQARPDSLDAGRETDERSPAERLEAPEQLRPQYAAAFAPADLHVARDLLAQTGAAALNVARVDLRRLIRTARQVDRERRAQQVWEEVCQEAGVHCDTAATDARFLLKAVGGRWAETLSDEQISGVKALADEWNDGFEGRDRIPYLRLVLAFRRYGRHLGDAQAQWRGALRRLGITNRQARLIVETASASRPVRLRPGRSEGTPLHLHRAYAAYRHDVNAERAFLSACERAGVSFHAGKAIARRALSVTHLRFAETLGTDELARLTAAAPAVMAWTLHHEAALGVSDQVARRLNVTALTCAFHAFGQRSGGREQFNTLQVTPEEVEALLAQDRAASRTRAARSSGTTPGLNLTRRAVQQVAEQELLDLDAQGQSITQALMALRARLDTLVFVVDLQDAAAQYRALGAAHAHFLTCADAYERAADTGHLLLMAEASLACDDAVRYCEQVIAGDAVTVAAASARHITEFAA